MKNDIWNDIKGYEKLYEITQFGKVRNKKTYRILKLTNNNGYLTVTLRKNKQGKTFTIHHLLAKTFIPNPKNYRLVRHLDDNRNNNNLDNLAWGTHSMNMIDRYNNGDEGKKVLVGDNKEFDSISECAKAYGITPAGVLVRIKSNKFNFKYK